MKRERRLVLVGLVWVVLAASAFPALAAPGGSGAHARTWYVSLGTSLAVGIQPDASGENQRTDEGYSDQLHEILKSSAHKLRLVKLGCPAETSLTMMVGGLCSYPKGSQLAEAAAFLKAHQQFVALVTIDIGANDLLPCAGGTAIDVTCVYQAFANLATNLPQILSALREAAGPEVPILAMNYYNPFVAAWFQDPALATASDVLFTAFNGVLAAIYGAFVIPVGDVAAAFRSSDFTIDPASGVPINVLLVCVWTYMCVPPPQGPNIHPDATGYGVIAETFLGVLP